MSINAMILTQKKMLKQKNTRLTGVKLLSMTSMAALLTGCFGDLGGDPETKRYYGTDGDDDMTDEGGFIPIFMSSTGKDTMHSSIYGATVDYSASNAGVTVYLDGQPNKGGHAEGDMVTGVQNIVGSNFDDVLNSGAEESRIDGKDGNDILNGAAGSDRLEGGAGNDKLYGNGGNDSLYGGQGGDLLDGGDGIDAVSYYKSGTSVLVNLDTGAAAGGDAQGDSYVSIENIVGSDHDDHLTGSAADNYITVYNGNNKIFGLGGNDQLLGGNGNDEIHGGAGNDIIKGGHGNNKLFGDAGDDELNIKTAATAEVNEISGGTGVDIFSVTNAYKRGFFESTAKSDFDIKITIQKGDNAIDFEIDDSVYKLNSIETIEYRDAGLDYILDVKKLWANIAVEEQNKFADETDFLSWLGTDAGYNYEGL